MAQAAAPTSGFARSASASPAAAAPSLPRERVPPAAASATQPPASAKSEANAYGKRNDPPFGAPMQSAAPSVTATTAERELPARAVRR